MMTEGMDEKDMEQEGQNEKKGWGIENKMVFFFGI
jgi:hypothetical protein